MKWINVASFAGPGVANLHCTHGHRLPFAIADPYGLGPVKGVAVV